MACFFWRLARAMLAKLRFAMARSFLISKPVERAFLRYLSALENVHYFGAFSRVSVVITSYSIHYTKLYELFHRILFLVVWLTMLQQNAC